MPFRDNRGPLEDLYALHIPNCDKRGQYNLKQVTPGVQEKRVVKQRGGLFIRCTPGVQLLHKHQIYMCISVSVQNVSAWPEGRVLVRQPSHRATYPSCPHCEGRPQLQPVSQRDGAPGHGPDIARNLKKRNCKVLGNKEHLSKLYIIFLWVCFCSSFDDICNRSHHNGLNDRIQLAAQHASADYFQQEQ